MPHQDKNLPLAIEVQHLTRTFGSSVKAVNDVSFSVKQGEIVGFLGPNGAGKSTTLRILAGLLPATSGRASIMGFCVATENGEIKRRIGYMPETNPLPDDMTVEEYLRYRACLKELPRWTRRSRVQTVMEMCDLQHKARKKLIGTLSKGFRQRVGIADAIIAQPDVVIMDEPTIGLDPHQVIGIRQLIDSMRGRMTVIISSHILSEIELSCDSVIIINHGRLVAQGSPQKLRQKFLPARRYYVDCKTNADTILSALQTVHTETRIVRSNDTFDGFTRYEIEIPNEAMLGEEIVHELVNKRHIHLREITCKKPCLEDVFLAATRQSWRETTEILPTKK